MLLDINERPRSARGGQKPAVRRQSTHSTATATTVSTDDSAISAGKSDEEMNTMISMLTKAVVEKQIAINGEEDLESSDHSGTSSVDVDAVAELIFQSVQRATAGKDAKEVEAIAKNFASFSSPLRLPSKRCPSRSSFEDNVSLPSLDGSIRSKETLEYSETDFDDVSVLSQNTSLPEGSPNTSSGRGYTLVASPPKKSSSKVSPGFSLGKPAVQAKKQEKTASVCFGSMFIREYKQILGDSPVPLEGPSLAIGWEFQEHTPVKIEVFEEHRIGRRHGYDMLLTRKQREAIVKKLGYSEEVVAEAVRVSTKARKQRRQTTNNLSSQKMEEAMEAVNQKLKNLLFRRR